MDEKILKVKKISSGATLPKRATEGSAGFDLFASLTSPAELPKNEIRLIPCGVAIELQKNQVGLMFARSGLALKFGINLANSVGVIDSDYRGEICAALQNFGSKTYTVSNGDRIAQLVIFSHETPKIVVCETLDATARNEKGFGSTGK